MLIMKFWLSAYVAAAIYNWLFFRHMDKVVYGKTAPIQWKTFVWFFKTLAHPVRLFKVFYCNMVMPEQMIAYEKQAAQARGRRIAWAKKIREGN